MVKNVGYLTCELLGASSKISEKWNVLVDQSSDMYCS